MSTYVITVVWTRPDLSVEWHQDALSSEAERIELQNIANLSISDTGGLSFESVWTLDASLIDQWIAILTKYKQENDSEKVYRDANGITRLVTTTLDGTVVPNIKP